MTVGLNKGFCWDVVLNLIHLQSTDTAWGGGDGSQTVKIV